MQMLQHCLTRMEQRHILTEEENIRNSNAMQLGGSGARGIQQANMGYATALL